MGAIRVPWFCFVVLVTASGFTSVYAATIDNNAPFLQHLKTVRKFPCSKPQPRAVSALELLDESVNKTTSEYIIPAMTVLYRCDAGSGCCWQGEHMACGPAGEEEVKLEFKLVRPMSREERQVWVTAKNHTKCSCRSINSGNASSNGDGSPLTVLRQR